VLKWLLLSYVHPQAIAPPLPEPTQLGTSVTMMQSPIPPLPSRDNSTGRTLYHASTNQIGKISSSKTSSLHSQILLWHKRICHVNFQSLYHMTTHNLIAGTPRIPLIKHTCSSCMLGKMPRDRIPKLQSTLTTKLLQLIHSDICGPMPIPSRIGSRYILTFIDDYTRKT
jgi:hypothetical protein